MHVSNYIFNNLWEIGDSLWGRDPQFNEPCIKAMKSRAPTYICYAIWGTSSVSRNCFPQLRDEGLRGTGNRPYYVPRVKSRRGLALCVLARIGSFVREVIFNTTRFNWDIDNLHNKNRGSDRGCKSSNKCPEYSCWYDAMSAVYAAITRKLLRPSEYLNI